jgi:predicted DsbA family dithiol-disulfide isomerase
VRLDRIFPAERLPGMSDYMKQFAASHGVYDFEHRDRMPNTRRALALAEVARDEGKLEPYRQRAMEAHWRDGMDLENDDDLRAIAREVGLSDDAVERSKDPQYGARLDAIREEAHRLGLTGIPTFILGRYRVSGAQSYEVFEELARRAGAEKRSNR